MTPGLCVAVHRHDPDRPRQAQSGMRLCAPCVDDLARRLDTIPNLLADLERALIPGGRGRSQRVTGNPETALPYNDRASDARLQLLGRLRSWTRLIAEEVGADLPADISGAGLSRWHRIRLDWIAAQPWVDDYAAELRQDTGWARAVLGGQRTKRVPLGACPDSDRCDVTYRTHIPCRGLLEATLDLQDELLPASVACTDCGRSYDPRQQLALGRRMTGGAVWLTTAEAAVVLDLSQRQVRDVAEGDADRPPWRRRDPDGVRPCRWDAQDVEGYRTRRDATVAHEERKTRRTA